jgi:hypothetical protein
LVQGEVEDAGQPDLAQAQEECQHGGGEIRLAPPLALHVHIASRRTLEDPVETRRHPLGVVAVVIAVSAIVFAGGFFLRLSPLPGLSSMRL